MSRDPFLRELFGYPKAPAPSPGPWTFRRSSAPDMRGNRYTVWLVLDANGKCVAECDHPQDAQHIAAHGPARPDDPDEDRTP